MLDDFSGQFFCIFEILFFALLLQVHDVETIYYLCSVLLASGNLKYK